MSGKRFYSNAHLLVAAIRILEHQNNRPPSIEEVSECLSFSLEQGNLLCKKLQEMEIIKTVGSGFDNTLLITNHTLLEEISQDENGDGLAKELQKFQDSRKDFSKKIMDIKAGQKKKQKDLFAEIEKKLKKDLEKE